MGGRVYDPTIGRFLSPDPFVQAPGNTQSFNRYSYVWNNPLSYTDPSGYQVCVTTSGGITRCTDGGDTGNGTGDLGGTGGSGGGFDDGIIGGGFGGGTGGNPFNDPFFRMAEAIGAAVHNYHATIASNRTAAAQRNANSYQNDVSLFTDRYSINYYLGIPGPLETLSDLLGPPDWVSAAGEQGVLYYGMTPDPGLRGLFSRQLLKALASKLPRINPTVSELRALSQKGFQAHHVLPEYLGKMLGYTTKQMGEHPGILVTQWKHTGAANTEALHKAISKYLPPMVGGQKATYTASEIRIGLRRAYNDLGHPELFDTISHLIK